MSLSHLGNSSERTTLTTRIKSLRKDKGWTIEYLAQQAGISKSRMWDLENASTPRPGAQTLNNVAIALGVTIVFLLGLQPKDTAEDEGFYRFYCKQKPEVKKNIRNIAKILAVG